MNFATTNKLSQEEIANLSLTEKQEENGFKWSEEEIEKCLQWYGKMGIFRLADDERQKDCNYIAIAENGEIRFEVWHDLVKAESMNSPVEAVRNVMEQLGEDYWDEEMSEELKDNS